MAFSLLLKSVRCASVMTQRSHYTLPRDLVDYYRPDPVGESVLSDSEKEQQLYRRVTDVVINEILYIFKKQKHRNEMESLDLAKYDLLDNFTIRPGQVIVGKKEINIPGEYDEIKETFEKVIPEIVSDPNPNLIKKAQQIGIRYSGGLYSKM